MCTAVVGGSIHRAATSISAKNNQKDTRLMAIHRISERRESFRRGVLRAVSAGTDQDNRCGVLRSLSTRATRARTLGAFGKTWTKTHTETTAGPLSTAERLY